MSAVRDARGIAGLRFMGGRADCQLHSERHQEDGRSQYRESDHRTSWLSRRLVRHAHEMTRPAPLVNRSLP